jgi:hypothetical protein
MGERGNLFEGSFVETSVISRLDSIQRVKADPAGKNIQIPFCKKRNSLNFIFVDFFGARWFLNASLPHPVPHSSSGVGALELKLPQETIRIISNWVERKWNFK